MPSTHHKDELGILVCVACNTYTYYNVIMDTTIRNLDGRMYRRLRARAIAAGMTVGQVLNEAMRAYLARPAPIKTSSLRDLVPEQYPEGNERLSEDIDAHVYGA